MSRSPGSTFDLARLKRLVSRKEYEEALRLAGAIIDSDPEFCEVIFERVFILNALGRREEAERDLDALIALRPEMQNARIIRARWAMESGAFSAALADLTQVIDSKDEYYLESARFFRAIMHLELGRNVQALRDCRELSDGFELWVLSAGRIKGLTTKEQLMELASA